MDSPSHAGSKGRLTAAILAGLVGWLAYGGAYAHARAAHLLVHEVSACDSDRIAPGAGASQAPRVIFAPLIALEEGYWWACSRLR